ncbi:MAG: response regulator [Chloroflexota bacterium]|nr:MAG: response regulator [Chloroflexota bacterium]
MAPQKILLIDQDPWVLCSLASILERDGYLVAGAAHAEEAILSLHESSFDLVVMDLAAKGVSELDLLSQILMRHPSLPVMILTAMVTHAALEEALKKGAVDYLIKPVEPAQILYRIKKLLTN